MKNHLARGCMLLLSCVLLLGAFASCNNKQKSSESTAATTEKEVTPGTPDDDLYDANGYLKDSLPESYDFDSDFVIFTWEEQKGVEWVDELPENPTELEEALYKRENNVESRFGVDISRIYAAGNWDYRSAFIATLSQNVLAGDRKYDLVGAYTATAGLGAVNGLYMNLNTNNYIDFSKPWWPSSIVETASVGDNLYFITGDISPTLIKNLQCMYVNLSMYNSYNCSDVVDGQSIYDVVSDYDWTYETMLMMARERVSVDAGNYGLVLQNAPMADSFFYGAGFMFLKNTDGILTISEDLTDNRLINLFDDLKELFTGRYEDVIMAENSDKSLFTTGHAIFYAGGLSDSSVFAEEGLSFSVLPMPLYNETQQEYATCANLWVTMYSIPIDAKDFNMSGVILEALGSAAYRTVSDEFYYDLFQMRYNGHDEGSSRMFDILSDSVVFDTARFFADEIGIFGQMREVIDPTANWSTIYSGGSASWQEKVTNLYAKLG